MLVFVIVPLKLLLFTKSELIASARILPHKQNLFEKVSCRLIDLTIFASTTQLFLQNDTRPQLLRLNTCKYTLGPTNKHTQTHTINKINKCCFRWSFLRSLETGYRTSHTSKTKHHEFTQIIEDDERSCFWKEKGEIDFKIGYLNFTTDSLVVGNGSRDGRCKSQRASLKSNLI